MKSRGACFVFLHRDIDKVIELRRKNDASLGIIPP